MRFARHIGIDYSGAQTLTTRLKTLQVHEAVEDAGPVMVSTPINGAKNWSRLEIAQYCLSLLQTGGPAIIGIDHGFSFPLSYMKRYGITTRNQFLADFMRH